MDAETWERKYWTGDFIPWAMYSPPSSFIVKHFPGHGCQERKNLKVFFPLCGCSADMKWVSDQGHSVTGCEFAERCCDFFAQNHELQYTQSQGQHGKITTFNEGNIKIYSWDIFKFGSKEGGLFDVIWDSAAFVALKEEERQRYSILMKSMLKPDGKLFITAADYEDGEMEGPPFPFPEELCDIYFNDMNVEIVDKMEEIIQATDTRKLTHVLRLFTFKEPVKKDNG